MCISKYDFHDCKLLWFLALAGHEQIPGAATDHLPQLVKCEPQQSARHAFSCVAGRDPTNYRPRINKSESVKAW